MSETSGHIPKITDLVITKWLDLRVLSKEELDEVLRNDSSIGLPALNAVFYVSHMAYDILARDSVSTDSFRRKYIKFVLDLISPSTEEL